MEHRISDLMESFADDRVELAEPRITRARRMKAMTLERLGLTPAKKTRPLGRTLLIAAVTAALLILSAFGIYQYEMGLRLFRTHSRNGLWDHFIVERYSPVGAIGKEAESPEALAWQAWQTYFWGEHEEDWDVHLPQDSPYRAYAIGWEGTARKLQSLADEYGLRLYQALPVTNWLEDFYEQLGCQPFMPLEDAEKNSDLPFGCVGEVYSDGSFQLYGVTTRLSDGREIVVHVHRAVRGSLCHFELDGDEPEDYLCESHTASGAAVTLALGPETSFVFAELHSGWVTITVSGGSAPERPGTELITMQDLQYIADSVDFEILDAISAPASTE